MKHFQLIAIGLLCALAPSAAGAAEQDDPIPYDDEPVKKDSEAKASVRKKKTPPRDESLREDDEREKEAEETTLTHIDDPNIGLSIELVAGLMLFDASRGGVDPRFMGGARFTWEWARLIPDEYLREMFFADLTYQVSGTSDGTKQVNATTTHHYVTIAPAIGYPFQKVAGMIYAQLGAGLNFSNEQIIAGLQPTSIAATKFLFQYGIGLRFRPAIVESEAVRLSFRFELTRFIRGYMHDMFIGGSVGVTF